MRESLRLIFLAMLALVVLQFLGIVKIPAVNHYLGAPTHRPCVSPCCPCSPCRCPAPCNCPCPVAPTKNPCPDGK